MVALGSVFSLTLKKISWKSWLSQSYISPFFSIISFQSGNADSSVKTATHPKKKLKKISGSAYLSFCVEPRGGVAEATGIRLEKFWILQLQAYMPFVQNDEMKIFEKETATSKSDALRENW